MQANPSINTDWLTAGFALLQPAGYVRRWVSFSATRITFSKQHTEALVKVVIMFLVSLAIAFSASAAEKPDTSLAIEYLEAAQFEQIINASIDAYVRQLLTQVPTEKRTQIEKMMRETMGWAATKNQIAELVVSMYTKEELKAYIAFSKTKSGRSYNEKSVVFSDKFSVVLAHNMQRFVEQNLVPPAGSETSQRAPK